MIPSDIVMCYNRNKELSGLIPIQLPLTFAFVGGIVKAFSLFSIIVITPLTQFPEYPPTTRLVETKFLDILQLLYAL